MCWSQLSSEVVSSIQEDEVARIEVSGKKVTVTYSDEEVGELQKDPIASFDETLLNLGVTADDLSQLEYSVVKESGFGYWMRQLLPFLFPFLFLVVFCGLLCAEQRDGWYAGVSVRAGASSLCQPK